MNLPRTASLYALLALIACTRKGPAAPQQSLRVQPMVQQIHVEL